MLLCGGVVLWGWGWVCVGGCVGEVGGWVCVWECVVCVCGGWVGVRVCVCVCLAVCRVPGVMSYMDQNRTDLSFLIVCECVWGAV